MNVAELEALEQRRQAHLQRQGAAENDGLLRHGDGVLDLVGPDVLDAHSVQELEGRGLERADDADVLVGVDVGREAAAHYTRLEAVRDGRLGYALERLACVAGEHVLEGEFVVAGGQHRALGVAAHEGLPPVLEDRDRLVDLVLRDARRRDLGLGEPAARVSTSPSVCNSVASVGGRRPRRRLTITGACRSTGDVAHRA